VLAPAREVVRGRGPRAAERAVHAGDEAAGGRRPDGLGAAAQIAVGLGEAVPGPGDVGLQQQQRVAAGGRLELCRAVHGRHAVEAGSREGAHARRLARRPLPQPPVALEHGPLAEHHRGVRLVRADRADPAPEVRRGRRTGAADQPAAVALQLVALRRGPRERAPELRRVVGERARRVERRDVGRVAHRQDRQGVVAPVRRRQRARDPHVRVGGALALVPAGLADGA
jgi:hypothetical protein